MNKKQLSEKVAKALSMKRATVEQVLDKSLGLISEALIRDEKVRLVGFGNFLVRTRATRIGRNPRAHLEFITQFL
jgi:DNA-binding protein HU-beta